jgi:hypothetical protein
MAQCLFSCQICYDVFGSKNVLKWHVINEHKMLENYYNDRFSAEVLKKTIHGCLLCGEELVFDSRVLRKHLVPRIQTLFFSVTGAAANGQGILKLSCLSVY